MKKVITFIILIGALSINAGAIVFEGERPIASAQMEKLSAHGHFEYAYNVVLTMSKLDTSEEPTGLTLSYGTMVNEPRLERENGQLLNPVMPSVRIIPLVITDRRDIGCGSVEYIANLNHNETKTRNPEHRFTVVLRDHTRRLCRDILANTWTAHVREGYGFCGTMDALMELQGHPQTVYTIQ